MRSEKWVYLIALTISLGLHGVIAVHRMPADAPAVKMPQKLTVNLKKLPAPAAVTQPAVKEPEKRPEPKPAEKPKPVPVPKPKPVKKAPEIKPEPVRKPEPVKEAKPAAEAEPAPAVQPNPVPAPPAAVTPEPKAQPAPPPEPVFDMQAYSDMVQGMIEENKTYPYMARRKGQQGLVIMSLTVNPDGTEKEIALATSSGSSILDREAEKLVRSVMPLTNDSGSELTLLIPIRYRLN